MMTYPRMWKIILILSHGLDTSRTLFLVPTDASFWHMNLAVEQNPFKGSCLVSGRWVLLLSRILAGRPLLACMHHPQIQQLCDYVQNQSYTACYQLTQEQEVLGIEGLVLWQKEHRGIGHGTCSSNLFLLDLSCRNSSPKCDVFFQSRSL